MCVSDLRISLSPRILSNSRQAKQTVVHLSFKLCTVHFISRYIHITRINSLLAYFKVSFHSPISARARLVSGLSRFFVKKVYIYYEVIRRYSHAPQGCNVVLISRLLQLHLHARYDSSLASARSFLFSILLDSYLDFSLSIEKCYYGRLRVCLSRGVGK